MKEEQIQWRWRRSNLLESEYEHFPGLEVGAGPGNAWRKSGLGRLHAASFVNGLQGNAAGDKLKVAASCKHYTAYDIDRWNGFDWFHFNARFSLLEGCLNGRLQLKMADYNSSEENIIAFSDDHQDTSIDKKYGGLMPKKKPLISKDHERAFFDSADWALCKQGAGVHSQSTVAIETLRPKLQRTPRQQLPPRRPDLLVHEKPTVLASRIHSDSDQVNELSSVASPQAHFGSENYISCTDSAALSPVGTSLQDSRSSRNGPSVLENPRSCTDSAALSPVGIGTSLQDSRNFGNAPLVSETQGSCTDSAAVSPVGTIHQVSRNAGNAPLVSGIRRISTYSAAVSPIGTSHQDSRNAGNAPLVSEIPRRSSDSAVLSTVGTIHQVSRNAGNAPLVSKNHKSWSDSASLSSVGTSHQGLINVEIFGDFNDTIASCDIYNGHWVMEEDFEPLYEPGSCPFVGDAFNCFKNGRPDSDYFRLRWKPRDCEIPRFDGMKMLKMLRGKRMVFVGDSINRNMWESLACALRESLDDKSRVFEASGRREFKNQGFYSFNFKDFECSIDFIRSPFLVQEWKVLDKAGNNRETLRLDTMQDSCNEYRDADIIIFNTGHWWTHQKTFKGNYYFQEGDHVYDKLEVAEAYKRALRTWAQWVDGNINTSRTSVFFRGYSASHFRGGQWHSGGNCNGETRPITNDTYLAPYPWMTKVQQFVISDMNTPVFYLNVTKMTDYRKDGHPSIFRQSASQRRPGMVQDCSHWCLPGVPDSWNELLYATMIKSRKFF
ncbi:protein trichome birefringence-like [Forsythia ovata]|uniref:Protein trichome birefringence-like n=2 Tax=Magnoliopsida TaxID=3398 RepID=A0ABD1P7G6_9LAMI